MIGAYGSLVVHADVYSLFVIVEGSETGSKYIVALEFVPEVTNCAIVLVVVVVLALLVILVLNPRFCVASAPQRQTSTLLRSEER